MAVTIAPTVQTTYPPRVALAVTGLTVGDAVEVLRVVAGTRTVVRGGSVVAGGTALSLLDAELPFGLPVSYVVTVGGADVATAAAVTYTLPGGKVALSDAITGLAAEVVISTLPDHAYTKQTAVFQVGGRQVVVSGELGMWSGTIELLVETQAASDNLRRLLAAATEGVVQLRQPGGYDGVDAYLGLGTASERRPNPNNGLDARRLWSVQVYEVEAWAPGLPTKGFSYADVNAYYSGQTYAQAETELGGQTYIYADVRDWSL